MLNYQVELINYTSSKDNNTPSPEWTWCVCVWSEGARGDPLLLHSKNKLTGKNCNAGEYASGVGWVQGSRQVNITLSGKGRAVSLCLKWKLCAYHRTPHKLKGSLAWGRETELSPIRLRFSRGLPTLEPETLTYTPPLQEEIDGIVNVCTLEFNTHLINLTFKLKVF